MSKEPLSKISGELLREAGLLVLVFGQLDHSTNIKLVWVSCLLLILGIAIERFRK